MLLLLSLEMTSVLPLPSSLTANAHYVIVRQYVRCVSGACLLCNVEDLASRAMKRQRDQTCTSVASTVYCLVVVCALKGSCCCISQRKIRRNRIPFFVSRFVGFIPHSAHLSGTPDSVSLRHEHDSSGRVYVCLLISKTNASVISHRASNDINCNSLRLSRRKLTIPN